MTLEYTVPELVRTGDSVQIDHPSGFRLLAGLPADAKPNTKIMISVPAGSEINNLTAVKREAVVNGTVGGVPTVTSTTLKVVEWKDNTAKFSGCQEEFGMFRWTHHCRKCGECVCDSCSTGRKQIPGYTDDQRVCNSCVQSEMNHLLTGGDEPVRAVA